jgi:hypothetical protein
VENPHQTTERGNNNNKENQQPQAHLVQGSHSVDSQASPNLGKGPEREEDTIMEMDEQDLADIDLDRLEEALNKKDLQTIPEDQLRKVHKVFLDSSAGATSRLGISVDPNLDPRRNPKENKRHGRKSMHQLIKEAGNYMINSGQIQRLSESSFSHPPNC